MSKKKIINNFLVLVVLFVLLIIVGFLTMKKPNYEYKIELKDTLDVVLNDSDFIRPEKAMAIIENKHPQFRFVDVRNPDEFAQGHLDAAINIPFKDLLAEEYQVELDQEKMVNVLYSSDELLASEACLLLKQIGYKNNMLLLGGYDFIIKYILDGYQAKMGSYPDEKANYDYAKIASETKGTTVEKKEIEAPKVEIQRKKVETKVAGGC